MTKEKWLVAVGPVVEDAVDDVLRMAQGPLSRKDVAKVLRGMAEDVAEVVYSGVRGEMMSTAQVSQLVGLSRQRLSELSRKYGIGVILGRTRVYTPEEVKLLVNRPKWVTKRDKGIDM